MVKAVKGFLTDDDTFYLTEDEAEYHEALRVFKKDVKDYATALSVDDTVAEQLCKFTLGFFKSNSKKIMPFVACYNRLHEAEERTKEAEDKEKEQTDGNDS